MGETGNWTERKLGKASAPVLSPADKIPLHSEVFNAGGFLTCFAGGLVNKAESLLLCQYWRLEVIANCLCIRVQIQLRAGLWAWLCCLYSGTGQALLHLGVPFVLDPA